MPKRVALVVDDTADILELAAIILTTHGGYEVLKAARSSDIDWSVAPDVALIDYMLENDDGVGGVHPVVRARREWPDTRIVLWTAAGESTLRDLGDEVLLGSVDEILYKPITRTSLINAVNGSEPSASDDALV